MNTGEDARFQGLYSSECCESERTFDKGECFCRCPACQRLCEWELLESPQRMVRANNIEDTENEVF